MRNNFVKKVKNLKIHTWTEWRSVWSKCHPENIRWAQVLFRNCFGRVLWSSFDLINFIPKIFILRRTVTRRNLSPDGPDGRFFKRKWLPGTEGSIKITFLKKCNDEQNNASRYQTFVIVQTDWFEQKIYIFLDSGFRMTRNKQQENKIFKFLFSSDNF